MMGNRLQLILSIFQSVNPMLKEPVPMFRLSWLAFISAVLIGCGESGPEVGKVQGTLSFDGKPLSRVLVSFVPQEGGPAASGTTNDQGEYRLVCLGDEQGATVGEHRVLFMKIEGEFSTDPERSADGDRMSNGTSREEAQVSTSGSPHWGKGKELTVQVEPGVNVIHFRFNSEGEVDVVYGNSP